MHDDTRNSIVKRENKFSIEILFLFYFDAMEQEMLDARSIE